MAEQEKWHVSKSINVGHLLTTIGIIVAVFVGINKFDKRMTIIEVNQANIREQQSMDRQAIKDTLSEIKGDITYIRKRVDEN